MRYIKHVAKKFVSLLLLLCSQQVFTQPAAESYTTSIEWLAPAPIPFYDSSLTTFRFTGANYQPDNASVLPYLSLRHENPDGLIATAAIEIIATDYLTESEVQLLENLHAFPGHNFIAGQEQGCMRNVDYSIVQICPIRLNEVNGKYEKLIEYRLKWVYTSKTASTVKQAFKFAGTSVLATGNWYKLGLKETGIYKIDRVYLKNAGINTEDLLINNIRLFGNGGRILPEKNSASRPDDLQELALYVYDENKDGKMNNKDYLLFYGHGTTYWDYQPASSGLPFIPIKNYYSDSTYYYLTTDNGSSKKMTEKVSSPLPETQTVNWFHDYKKHEIDGVNIVKSGREFYGENFGVISTRNFNFNFPNILADTVFIETVVAGTSRPVNANYRLLCPNGVSTLISCPNLGGEYEIAAIAKGKLQYLHSGNENPEIKLELTNATNGYLDYITLNAKRKLIMTGEQMSFRNAAVIGKTNISRFDMQSNTDLIVFDVTDPNNSMLQNHVFSGNQLYFKTETDTLREFIAITGNTFFTPSSAEKINNQNLHALNPADYIIICNPLFKQQAQQLAELHAKEEKLSYIIATIDEIYNEFSSGRQDISAIRDFIRMLYTRASTPKELPQYVLLLGDGSFDNLHRYDPSNTNLIPTYQSYGSVAFYPKNSFTSDDFFGMMDVQEGDFTGSYIIDLGVGRLSVKNIQEATGVVNKILSYYRKENYSELSSGAGCAGTGYNSGEWKNQICLLADDADKSETVFAKNSEVFFQLINNNFPNYTINKIYLDAYKQESLPGGQRYPDATRAFEQQMEKGALIVNYTGHGGEISLSHEVLIDVPQILNWKNKPRLPVFFTATCEFSRFDDPGRTSAGEHVLLNPNGGAIALFTTTRLAFVGDDDALCPHLFKTALSNTAPTGRKPTIGDICRITKSYQPDKTYFTLLGDPAVTLAYPQYRVFTTAINQHPQGSIISDTLSALQQVEIHGFVGDTSGVITNDFNGTIYISVFDKFASLKTLGNDNPADTISYKLQKNILFKGKASVKNGLFSFQFIVPKDISYHIDKGKISYYANGEMGEANGYYTNFMIGGTSSKPIHDDKGPEINLYLNNNRFVFGGTTNENPVIYAELFDSSGINTTGNGIGHDLVAILDGNIKKPIVLNDAYQSDLNSFRSGKITFPLRQLQEGNHTLTLKAWDILNNSSVASTEFVVAPSENIAIKHVLNYPNPFSTQTKFFVEHNQCCSLLQLEIKIFTISGAIVKTIHKQLLQDGFRSEGIEWDGRDDFGDKIGKGVYVYRVKLMDYQGKQAEQYEKLVIIN